MYIVYTAMVCGSLVAVMALAHGYTCSTIRTLLLHYSYSVVAFLKPFDSTLFSERLFEM
jgi:hypothetical protein